MAGQTQLQPSNPPETFKNDNLKTETSQNNYIVSKLKYNKLDPQEIYDRGANLLLKELKEEGSKLLEWSYSIKEEQELKSNTEQKQGAVLKECSPASDLTNDRVVPERNLNLDPILDLDKSGNVDNQYYKDMIKVLQYKYNLVLRKFDEINEQRMSYIEGLHEYQAKLDNSRSIIQLQRQEISRYKEKFDHIVLERNELSAEIDSYRRDMNEFRNREDELITKVNEGQAEITKLTNQLYELSDQIKDLSFMPKVTKNGTYSADERYTYMDSLTKLSQYLTFMLSLLDPSSPQNPIYEMRNQEELESFIYKKLEVGPSVLQLQDLVDFNFIHHSIDLMYRIIETKNESEERIIQETKKFNEELAQNDAYHKQIIETYANKIHNTNAHCHRLKLILSQVLASSNKFVYTIAEINDNEYLNYLASSRRILHLTLQEPIPHTSPT